MACESRLKRKEKKRRRRKKKDLKGKRKTPTFGVYLKRKGLRRKKKGLAAMLITLLLFVFILKEKRTSLSFKMWSSLLQKISLSHGLKLLSLTLWVGKVLSTQARSKLIIWHLMPSLQTTRLQPHKKKTIGPHGQGEWLTKLAPLTLGPSLLHLFL